eukprot:g5112.t1
MVMLAIEKWNFLHSTYFALATMLAIGYGDFYPTLTETKIFTALYVFVGITLTTVAAAINISQDLVWMYEDYCDDVAAEEVHLRRERIRRRTVRMSGRQGGASGGGQIQQRSSGAGGGAAAAAGAGGSSGASGIATIGGGASAAAAAAAGGGGGGGSSGGRGHQQSQQHQQQQAQQQHPLWRHHTDWLGIGWSCCSVVIFLCTGTLFLMYVEGGKFNAINSFYFTAVTMGHVGYGDITPHKPISLAFMIVFILCTWGGYTVIMGKIINVFLKKEHLWELEDTRVRAEESCERRMKEHWFLELSDDELLAQRKAFRAQVANAVKRRSEHTSGIDVDDADNPEMTPAAHRPGRGGHGTGATAVPSWLGGGGGGG